MRSDIYVDVILHLTGSFKQHDRRTSAWLMVAGVSTRKQIEKDDNY
jgi:hypothetical protein